MATSRAAPTGDSIDTAHRSRATLIGFMAVLLWSSLAVVTAMTRAVPPFQLLAMSFAIGGLAGVVVLTARGRLAQAARHVPLLALALSVTGLFGYHFFYFLAFRLAPAVEVNLINYLWPLLIVLFSALLPGPRGAQRLRWWHVVGAGLGFAGTALIIAGAGGQSAEPGSWQGFACAVAAALVWSSYSVTSRLFASVPSGSIALACLLTAALAALCHVALETTSWPQTGTEWIATLIMGLGPLGLAFYLWDYGCKHGDIRVLGASAYAAPPLSTLLLVALGIGAAGAQLWLACLLITGGGLLAAHEMLFARNRG